MVENKLQIERRIFKFIDGNSYSDISKISAQTMLFKEGIFDSMSFMLLIDFLEIEFGIKAKNDDLIEENFISVSAISDFVLSKKTAEAA